MAAEKPKKNVSSDDKSYRAEPRLTIHRTDAEQKEETARRNERARFLRDKNRIRSRKRA